MPIGRPPVPILDRLKASVDIHSETGCWEWNKHLDRYGYGQTSQKGKTITAHRAMYEAIHGVIPDGMVVRHKCDNRKCCNIDHLDIGTPKDNARDMIERGRFKMPSTAFKPGQTAGEKNGRCKLTDAKILELYNKTREKLPYGGLKKLAEAEGISYIMIQKIRDGTYGRLAQLLSAEKEE